MNRNMVAGVRTPNFQILYERLQKATDYPDPRIRKKPFDNSVTLSKAKELLANKIFRCFSTEEGESNFGLIQAALLFNAVDYAKNTLQSEYNKAQESKDLLYQFQLLEFAHDSKIVFNQSLLPDSRLTELRQIHNLIGAKLKLNEYLERIRLAYKDTDKERHRLSVHLDEFLSRNVNLHKEFPFLLLKVEIGSKILTRLHLAAAALQFQLAALYIRTNTNSLEKFKEVSNAVLSAIECGRRDKAEYYNIALNSVECTNRIHQIQKDKLTALRTIELGFAFGNLNQIKSGMASLVENKDRFSHLLFLKYTYLASLGCLFLQEFSEGHAFLKETQGIPNPSRNNFYWQIDILDYIFHSEKGNWEYITSTISSKKRKYRGSGLPMLILETIEERIKTSGELNDFGIHKYLEKLTELKSQSIARKQLEYFDFALYLMGKLHGSDIYTSFRTIHGDIPMNLAI